VAASLIDGMLSKFFITALIVVLAYLVLRARGRRVMAVRTQTAAPQPPVISPRLVAYLFLSVAAVSGALIYWAEWADDRHVITIRVISSRTGEAVTYQAQKGKIHGRRFETLDGRKVSVADVDRVEMREE
jgi:hypothetical protein